MLFSLYETCLIKTHVLHITDIHSENHKSHPSKETGLTRSHMNWKLSSAGMILYLEKNHKQNRLDIRGGSKANEDRYQNRTKDWSCSCQIKREIEKKKKKMKTEHMTPSKPTGFWLKAEMLNCALPVSNFQSNSCLKILTKPEKSISGFFDYIEKNNTRHFQRERLKNRKVDDFLLQNVEY
ncbi:PREDICTED: uncharacterized protein LOC104820638 [Tarenaya hassleriana]|uniref:uncharacterized protein LOC104820638 n=1 Tax=Tarenaya hassleriana TaxID=28532 RepID=UPI00053C1B04|nr:PREDICTED: uncharacterized protein LOC104820638 [Tarenaya hassleriana]XP_010549482.1 PREDICTED: uncharacterized protein LOC104820638 [Tarenaya hassleriana]XP_010549498.1 PREDICTED: uncharacterized protein LOC104820638 [Tarenaya hassleriana]XP_010549507.1 PREDICTED: uncharacterized protein LOC104820638 [Tarenaya hassleriana]